MVVNFRFSWVFLFLSLVSIRLEAQDFSRIDSLNNQLSASGGVERFNLLNDIGFAYRLSYPDSTIFYCTRAYDLGLQLELKKDLSKPLSFIGLASAYKGDYKRSVDYHTQAIDVALEQQDSTQLGYSYNNFGRLFFDQGDMARAYKNLITSQVIFEKIQDPVGLAYVYRSLANVYKSQRDYPKALQASKEAYSLRKQLEDPRALLSAAMELGSVYGVINQKEEANRYFQEADSIAKRINDEISLAEILIGWAEFLVVNKDSTKAHELSHEAYTLIEKTENIRLKPRATLLMGHVHFVLGETEPAKYFLEPLVAADDSNHPDIQRDAYFFLSKIYEGEGKSSAATLAFNKYLILKEALQSIELAREIEKLQFQLDIEKIERENEMLKANEAKNEAIIRQQQLENLILVLVILSVIVLLIILWLNTQKRSEANERLALQNQKIDKQREKISAQNEKLEARNKQLSELNNEKDSLMNIVAHDLKSPLNRIRGLSDLIELEGNLNEHQKKYLSLLKHSTRSGLDLIVDLLDVSALEANRTPNYSYFDLGSIINERVNAFHYYASTKSITLESTITIHDLFFLDQDYIIRILDNLISNAIKFSTANSKVHIRAEIKEVFCSISVSDEGPGFAPEDLHYLYQKFKKLSARPTGGESSNGLGLAIVKTLVERLKGRIELYTEEGKGSTFEILFPLKNTIQI
jgi:signal transduction histidine kinase